MIKKKIFNLTSAETEETKLKDRISKLELQCENHVEEITNLKKVITALFLEVESLNRLID